MSGITDPRRAERYIRRRWGRFLREAFFIDIPNLHGLDRRWFAVVTFDDEQFLTIPVLSQTFLTSPTGSLQTSTSDITWNNANNKVECVGGGGSGACGHGSANQGTGGGGGCYSAITNFTFATPGTTTYQWEVATGGAAVSLSAAGSLSGNVGNSTWFNAAADPGNGSDNTKCSAAGGGAGIGAGGAITSGGAGGATTSSWGTTKNAGGTGGGATAAVGKNGLGGGGAGGPTAAGANGVSTAVSTVGSNGGAADVGGTGAGTAGTGATSSGNPTGGGAGTEFDGSSHGCGGGGGGGSLVTGPGGSGGNYGGGGGGLYNTTGTQTSGAGGPGIVVLTWTPAPGGKEWYNLTILRVQRSAWKW